MEDAAPRSLEMRRRTYLAVLGSLTPFLPWLAWMRRDEPVGGPIYLLMFAVVVVALAGLVTRRLAVVRVERLIIVAIPVLMLARLFVVTVIDPVPLGVLRQLVAETAGPTAVVSVVVIYLAFDQARARTWSIVLWVAFTALLVRPIVEGASTNFGAGAALVRQSVTLAIIAGMTHALASIKAKLAEERTRARTLEELAHSDALTGINNRRGIEVALAAELDRVARYGGTLSVALFDLDGFKARNDHLGHAAGDTALIAVVEALEADLRATDILGRWGGDELLVVAPATSNPDALQIAERWRAAVAELGLAAGDGEVTTSIGIATLRPGDDLHTLLVRADRALYAAKTRGGDQVMSGEDLEARPLRGRQRSAGQLPRGRDERHRDHEHAQRAGAQPSPVAATEGPADG
ncbi:MAG: GGDEF domain-containing protein [Nitriliruptor sp.]|uniref:GGDEF domain-containing protein n=1 Tax=Nitriliruptor sp. TaxID=2448056 RepID=UPI0034A074B1